jgi:hypothetical protein
VSDQSLTKTLMHQPRGVAQISLDHATMRGTLHQEVWVTPDRHGFDVEEKRNPASKVDRRQPSNTSRALLFLYSRTLFLSIQFPSHNQVDLVVVVLLLLDP